MSGTHEGPEDVKIFHHRGHRGRGGLFCDVILGAAFFATARLGGRHLSFCVSLSKGEGSR
jgi:hypothetical protein